MSSLRVGTRLPQPFGLSSSKPCLSFDQEEGSPSTGSGRTIVVWAMSGPFTCARPLRFLFGIGLLRRGLLRLGFRLGALLVAKALLQRRHQVDDVGALGRGLVGLLDDLLALGLLLLLDQLVERVDVAVVEVGGIE